MRLRHEKSKCCGAKIIRFGGKRRQCVACKKTWRVYPSKRGRKALRKQENYLLKVLIKVSPLNSLLHAQIFQLMSFTRDLIVT